MDLGTEPHSRMVTGVARAVADGLSRVNKKLPSWLFYDDAGSALYGRITELPEYYLTRAEAAIFTAHGDAIVDLVAADARVALAEIGAGNARKTEVLLEAIVRRQHRCRYLACDISRPPLEDLKRRIPRHLPTVDVRPAVVTHEGAVPIIAALADRQVLLFIGSSLGNYDDTDAVALLRLMREGLRDDAFLVLGVDIAKDHRVLHAAYDDAAGVTAAFNKNLLRRLNRELDANFDLDSFEHVAVVDEVTSDVGMFLESTCDQEVHIGALSWTVGFLRGERIETELSAKYDLARVDRILMSAGYARAHTFCDDDVTFAVHVARVRAGTGWRPSRSF